MSTTPQVSPEVLQAAENLEVIRLESQAEVVTAEAAAAVASLEASAAIDKAREQHAEEIVAPPEPEDEPEDVQWLVDEFLKVSRELAELKTLVAELSLKFQEQLQSVLTSLTNQEQTLTQVMTNTTPSPNPSSPNPSEPQPTPVVVPANVVEERVPATSQTKKRRKI